MAAWAWRVFADGSTRSVADMTVERLLLSSEAVRREAVEWAGDHVTTRHRVCVKRRPDRGLLVSIFEQQ